MRCLAFNSSIALLAFGTGVFFLYLFSPRNPPPEPAVQIMPTPDLAAVSVSNEKPLHQETGVDSLISDKEKALLLFEPTLKKWLDKKNIGGTIEPSPEILERIMATRLHQYEAPYLTQAARKSYQPSLRDLNSDGRAELFILVNCKDSTDCELWVFREANKDFEVILRAREKFEKFEVKKSKSKGFSDIQTSFRPTEPEAVALMNFDYYKFDGREYTFKGCAAYVNRYQDKKGELRYLKKPVLQHFDDCC